jgi:hypothetical protein
MLLQLPLAEALRARLTLQFRQILNQIAENISFKSVFLKIEI